MTDAVIKYREEIAEQIKSLQALKKMAAGYGYDVSLPAKDAKEAVQFLYFAYLAAIKDQNGAAMSFGRNTTFLDIYFERDIRRGVLTEREAQELTDQLRDEAAHSQIYAHQGIQRTVFRRSHVGDGIHRRHGRGRQNAGDQDGVQGA